MRVGLTVFLNGEVSRCLLVAAAPKLVWWLWVWSDKALCWTLFTLLIFSRNVCSSVGHYSTFLLLFSCSVVSNSVTHVLQHPRLPDSSLHPRVCSNSCPLSQRRHPTISSSVIPFSSCPQSFLTSGSFSVSQLITSGGQSVGASTSVLPMNIQD